MTFRLLAALVLASSTLAAQMPGPPPGLPARDRAYDLLLDGRLISVFVALAVPKAQS